MDVDGTEASWLLRGGDDALKKTSLTSAGARKTLPQELSSNAGGRFANTLTKILVGPTPLLIHLISLLLASIAASECHLVISRTLPNAPLLPSVIYGVVLWYWWGIAAVVLWRWTEGVTSPILSSRFVLVPALLAVLFAGSQPWLLQATIKHLISIWPVLGAAGYGSLDYLNWNRFFFGLLLYGFIFGITAVIRMQGNSQREAMRMLSLQKELSEAHLRALQMQIEPHFLFNTLNAIQSLVESSRRAEALQTLHHLNIILKSTLKRERLSKVKLAEEVELVDNYLAIEEVRFSDRMRVQMTLDPATLDAQVPSFLLQPVVENAIRHGIAKVEQGGVIQLKTWRSNEHLHLLVKNTAPSTASRSQVGHGIGLRNTRERLAHLYGAESQIRAFVPPEGGFEVQIDIPFEASAV